MGAYKFAFKMLRVNRKLSFIYLLSIIFPMAVIFNLLNVMNNKNFFFETQYGRVDVAGGLVFFLALLVCIFTFYANSYFIAAKSKEMAIEELSGIWPGLLARMLLFENAIIEIIGCAIGILVGIAVMPVFLKIMYIVMGKSGSIWMISPEGIWGTIWILILQLGYVCMGDYSYASTREIIDLMNINKKVRFEDIRFLKLNSKVYVAAYLIPIIFIFIAKRPDEISSVGTLNIVFTAVAIPGLLKYYIPEKILAFKKKKYLNDKVKLISLSNVHEALKQMKFLIITLALTVEVLLCIMAIYQGDVRAKTMCIISYVIAVIMISVSIIYKIVLDSDNRKKTFRQLRLVGYTREQLQKAAVHELKVFYAIVMGLPLFHILIFLFLFRRSNMISTEVVVMMLGVFFAAFLITIIVSYFIYRKLVFQKDAYRIL